MSKVTFEKPVVIILVANALKRINKHRIFSFLNEEEFDSDNWNVEDISSHGTDFDGIECGEYEATINFENGITYTENNIDDIDTFKYAITLNGQTIYGKYER